jgi:hypothetical protein
MMYEVRSRTASDFIHPTSDLFHHFRFSRFDFRFITAPVLSSSRHMKFIIPGIAFFCLTLPSCRVAEENIAGIYLPQTGERTRLILKEDKTFEFALLNPATDTLLFHQQVKMNFFTTGVWQYENKKLVLKSAVTGESNLTTGINDSITHFTNISSFNFWTRFGDPVSIRYILLPPSRPKPHFGNSLYYFAQDFKETDTLKFYFDGYPPFIFPGSVPSTIGNNMHKVVLQEPYLAAAFADLDFTVKKNKLICSSGRVRFEKK